VIFIFPSTLILFSCQLPFYDYTVPSTENAFGAQWATGWTEPKTQQEAGVCYGFGGELVEPLGLCAQRIESVYLELDSPADRFWAARESLRSLTMRFEVVAAWTNQNARRGLPPGRSSRVCISQLQ
jgi:hypothetical protein